MYKTRCNCNISLRHTRRLLSSFNESPAGYQHISVVAALILLLLTASCAPYPVKPDVSRTEAVSLAADEIVVTWEPRFMLRKFAEAVREAHQNIEVVDAPALLDIAIPGGERTLRKVLHPDTCRRIANQLNVTYLVLVGPLYEHEGEIEGPLMVGIGAWGVAKQELEARFGATIFNLVSGEPLCHVTAEADAKMVIAGWFFPFVVGPWAEGDLNTIRGVANEVGKAITEDAKFENVRIVVMAAVSDQQALEDENLMARAKQGDVEAQYKIHWGLVKPENLRWLCLAADQDHRAAQGRLGDIYYHGWFGVDTDFVRSYMWFTLAAKGQGEWADWAEEKLKYRFKELTPDEVRRAEKMVAEWEPGQCERELVPASSDK